MPFSMSQASLPVFEIGLNALAAVLDKAAAHVAAKKIDPTVLVGWRLAPDMFSFGRQVQVACDQAKNGSARLAGVEPPKFEDNETTLDQLKERITKTVAFLKTLDAKAKGPDAAPWAASASSPFYAADWKGGDKAAWEAQIRTRNQGQNDYAR